jgi:hypothetical protein
MVIIGEIAPGQIWQNRENKTRFRITRIETVKGVVYVFGSRREGLKPVPVRIKADNMLPNAHRYRLVKEAR